MQSGEEDLAARLGRAIAGLEGVRVAFLFGSQATGRARADSDLDVAVLVDDDLLADPDRVLQTLLRLAGCLGSAVPPERLDLVLLNHADVVLRHRVVRDGALLFERSARERVRFVSDTLRVYLRSARWRQRWRQVRRTRLREGVDLGGSGGFLAQARRAQALLGANRELPRD